MVSAVAERYGSSNFIKREGRVCIVYSLNCKTVSKVFNLYNYCVDIIKDIKDTSEIVDFKYNVHRIIRDLIRSNKTSFPEVVFELKDSYQLGHVIIDCFHKEDDRYSLNALAKGKECEIKIHPSRVYTPKNLCASTVVDHVNRLDYCVEELLKCS